jgi:hypothetical protein
MSNKSMLAPSVKVEEIGSQVANEAGKIAGARIALAMKQTIAKLIVALMEIAKICDKQPSSAKPAL